MKQLWIKLSTRLDAMTLRERCMVFGAAVAAVLFLMYSLSIEPLLARQKVLLAQISQQGNQIAGPAEYGHEVARVVEFLHTGGRSLLDAIGRSRDRLSEEMMFEEAARQHKRFEKVEEVLKLRDELAQDSDRLNGVAITRSLEPAAVEMWFVREGNWQEPQRFSFEVHEGKTVSLDVRRRNADRRHVDVSAGKV